MTKERSH